MTHLSAISTRFGCRLTCLSVCVWMWEKRIKSTNFAVFCKFSVCVNVFRMQNTFCNLFAFDAQTKMAEKMCVCVCVKVFLPCKRMHLCANKRVCSIQIVICFLFFSSYFKIVFFFWHSLYYQHHFFAADCRCQQQWVL